MRLFRDSALNFSTNDRIEMDVSSSRRISDTVEELPQELIELGNRISAIPLAQQRELEGSYRRVVESFRRRRRILSLVQEALSQLRLDIKYLMFDLEITRRERDALRDQLNEERP
jgi:hypothetical protein